MRKFDLLHLFTRVILIVLTFIGIYLMGFGDGAFMSATPLVYYTTQSNIWIALCCLAFIVLDIASRLTSKTLIKPWMCVVKFVLTVAITLTFVVFALLLAPSLPIAYLLGTSNICVHFLVPLLAIFDLLLPSRYPLPLQRKNLLPVLSILPALLYMIATYILSHNGMVYHNNAPVPYFFMNYQLLGWFKISSDRLGVAYWFLIIALFLFGLGRLLLFIINKQKSPGYNK